MSTFNPNADFDWFATDETGALALFSTGGRGFVPDTVIDYHVMHDTVAGGIEYPHWGTPELWQDVTVLGLFVYDWSEAQAGYQQVAAPDGPCEAAMREMIERIVDLPRMPARFADGAAVTQVDAFLPPDRPKPGE